MKLPRWNLGMKKFLLKKNPITIGSSGGTSPGFDEGTPIFGKLSPQRAFGSRADDGFVYGGDYLFITDKKTGEMIEKNDSIFEWPNKTYRVTAVNEYNHHTEVFLKL